MKTLEIAQALFGALSHIDNGIYCKCPGESKHTHPTRERDCRIYGADDGVPTIYCCHKSCLPDITEANYRFRSAVGRTKSQHNPSHPNGKILDQWTPPKYEEIRNKAALRAEQSAIEAERLIPIIQRDYVWNFADTAPIPPDPNDQYDEFLKLWQPTDRLWIGDNRWSGKWAYCAWGTAEQWMRRGPSLQGVQTSFCTYKPGSMERKNENVLVRRYLVFECDKHPKSTQAAIINWMRSESGLGLPLRMVCDTGGKSLHAWFDAADLTNTDLISLKSILTGAPDVCSTPLQGGTKHGWHPGLGGDPAMFVPSQPVRLPGPVRPGTEIPQSIVWLA